jgi:hypothetical protein
LRDWVTWNTIGDLLEPRPVGDDALETVLDQQKAELANVFVQSTTVAALGLGSSKFVISLTDKITLTH